MWGAGYYDAAVTISIDRASLSILSTDINGFARTAESYRNRDPAPVTIAVNSGPLFSLRSIRVLGPAGAELSETELPARIVRLKPGDPAAAADLRAAQAGIVDYFRKEGRPLVKIASVAPVVDHAAHVMDVTFTADPGPIAPFGEATMNGPNGFDPRIARSFLYIYPGDPLFAAGGGGRAEQRPRNPRGRRRADHGGSGARRLWPPALHGRCRGPPPLCPRRVGEIFDHQRPGRPGLLGGPQRLRRSRAAAPAGRHLLCAAMVGNVAGYQQLLDSRSRIPLLRGLSETRIVGYAERPIGHALVERMSTSGAGFLGYEVEDADANVALRHRFNQNFWVQARLEAQTGVATDALGRVNYTLVGVPISANYDTTDSKLDPTRGVRFNASVDGFPIALGSSVDLVQAKARASAYYLIDPDSRFVLAGVVGAGAMGGAELADIPANWRFYAGGGGSVRGYAYNSLGPYGPFGAVIGGRSLFQILAELRVRVTDTIDVVPFFDAGNAYASDFPNFSAPLYKAVGIGLRYIRRSGRSGPTSPSRCNSAPEPGGSRSMSALGRLSDDPASPSHGRACGAARGAARALAACPGGRGGQGRPRQSAFEGAVVGGDQRLDRRGRRRLVLRRLDQRHRSFGPQRALAQGRQGPTHLDPARLVRPAAGSRSADHRPH
jgi:translocation and assembly module TamA